MTTLDLHGGINKYAVYTGASDAPLTAPMSNLSSLKWHSDLEYAGVATKLTGTIDLAFSGWSGFVNFFPGTTNTTTLVAHGRSYRPLLLGKLTVGSTVYTFHGDIVFTYSNGETVLLGIQSDATNITLEATVLLNAGSVPSTTATFEIMVFNVGLDASNNFVRPTLNTGFEATTTRMVCGRFDTNFSYPKVDAASPVKVIRGKSIDVAVGAPNYGPSNYRAVGFRYSVGGIVNTNWTSTGNNSGFNAAVTGISA